MGDEIRTSQELIVSSLRRRWAGIGIVGEEGELESDSNLEVDLDCSILDDVVGESSNDLAMPASEITIYVDPLDGTKGHTNAC